MLPRRFRLSQSSLVAYATCRRRFWLRYAEQLDWPAPATNEGAREEARRQGLRFHRLVQQCALDLDVAPLVARSGPALQRWWKNYRQHPPPAPKGTVHSEIELAAPLGTRGLTATFDRLVAGDEGRWLIIDWKTGQQAPDRAQLAASWQTTVYPFVLVEGGRALSGAPIQPDQVTLLYWFAEHPQQPVRFDYDADAHAAARQRLTTALDDLHPRRTAKDFPKTDDHAACRRCTFCAYCQRAA